MEPKCALLLREAGPGDRILLPRAWQEGCRRALRNGCARRGRVWPAWSGSGLFETVRTIVVRKTGLAGGC
jgi:hypothetical protein